MVGAGGGEARGDEDVPHGVRSGGRAEEVDNTRGFEGSTGLAVTSDGEWTRKSDRDISRGRSFLERTGEEGEDLRVGTRSADHRSTGSGFFFFRNSLLSFKLSLKLRCLW